MWNLSFADTEQVFKCDLVLLALGFLGPEKYVAAELGVKLTSRNNIHTDRAKYATSVPNVFSAGGE